MAFNDLGKFHVDASDLELWAKSGCARAFIAEVGIQKDIAFKKLLKDGEKKHSENAESYKAYDKVLRLFESATKAK